MILITILLYHHDYDCFYYYSYYIVIIIIIIAKKYYFYYYTNHIISTITILLFYYLLFTITIIITIILMSSQGISRTFGMPGVRLRSGAACWIAWRNWVDARSSERKRLGWKTRVQGTPSCTDLYQECPLGKHRGAGIPSTIIYLL